MSDGLRKGEKVRDKIKITKKEETTTTTRDIHKQKKKGIEKKQKSTNKPN